MKIKGKNELYIGYIFLEGYIGRGIKGNEYIRAPLFLIPCKLTKNKEDGVKWFLERNNIEEDIVNCNLINYLSSYMDLNKSEDVLKINSFEGENVIFNVFKILKKLNINIGKVVNKDVNFNEETENINITKFKDYKSDEIPKIKDFEATNKFKLLGYCVLGMYSKSGSALFGNYTELIKLLNNGKDLGLASELLNFLHKENEDVEYVQVDNVVEEEKYFVTQVDNSQEEAILQLEKDKAVIVEGPPGTGKSQLITSLISNSLAKGRKLLIVCEKEVGLKVIFDRLEESSLGKYAALIDDVGNTQKKNLLYESIKSNMKNSEEKLEVVDKRFELRKKNEEIDEKTKKLNTIATTLYKKMKCGITPYDMYSYISTKEEIKSNIFLENLSNELNIDDLKSIKSKINKIADYEDIFEGNNILKHRKSFKDFNSSYKRKITSSIDNLIEEYDVLTNNESYKKILKLSYENSYGVQSIIEAIDNLRVNLFVEEKSFIDKIKKYFWIKIKSKEYLKKVNLLHVKDIKDMKNIIKEYEDSITKLTDITNNLEELKLFFKEDSIQELKSNIYKGNAIKERLNNTKEIVSNKFDEIIEYDKTIDSLDKKEEIILNELTKEKIIDKNKKAETWLKILDNTVYEDWIDIAEREYSILKDISYDKYSEIVKEYRGLIKEKEKLVPEVIDLILRTQIEGSEEKQEGKLWRELGKKRGACPIIELVKKYIDKGLLNYKPVWLVTPDIAATIFPLEKEIFDIIIFDEASQLKIQQIIPLVYRAKKLVVAGDEKQLPPSGESEEREEKFDNTKEIEEIKQLRGYKSFLEFCNNIFSKYQKSLLWHYRSEYEELINFSNHAFYKGQIQVSPNIIRETKNKAIEWVKIEENAFIEDSKNEIEAQRVCEEMHRVLKEYRGKSLGVIAFTKKQQECIQKFISKKCDKDIEFKNLYEEAQNKENKKERIFISNIDEIQGDERDIIMFSIGYAPNKDGKFNGLIVGNLNKEEGQYRLNVAITRAKNKIVVVTSIEPSIFNEIGSKSKGASLLQDYLEYCKAVCDNDKAKINRILRKVNSNQSRKYGKNKCESPFEVEVVDRLIKKEYTVDPQIGCSKYRIDIAIVHPKDKNRYILGVEADGAMYHSAKSAKERDIYRQKFLERQGWKLERIWSRDWWKNKDREIMRIEEKIKDIMREE